jgi:hypothetical protein
MLYNQLNVELPASVRIDLRGRSSHVFDVIAGMFGLSQTTDSTEGIPLEIIVPESGDKLERLPFWLYQHISGLFLEHDLRMFYADEGQIAASLCQQGNTSCAWFDRKQGRMGFFTYNNSSGPSFFSVQTVLAPVLREVFLARRAVLLHAASLLCPNDTGVMLLGDGGGGKTTTALALMLKGAKLLSDDLSVVQINGHKTIIEGIPEKMNLTYETLSFFEELSDIRDHFDELHTGDGRDKTAVLPHDLIHSNCTTKKCQLHAIYHVLVTDQGPAVKIIPSAKALGLLLRAHTFASDQRVSCESFSQLCSLADSVKVYGLDTGPNPNVLAKWFIGRCQKDTIYD